MIRTEGIAGSTGITCGKTLRVLPVVVLILAFLCVPALAIPPLPAAINITDGVIPAPVSLTLAAHPAEARIGDTIVLNGTVTGINTIAVYLYVTAPGLDPRGVALENLNIAAGRGLFTTAPVRMGEGTWSYDWDTSIVVGNMQPGTYTVHVVTSPLDRIRSNPQESVPWRSRSSPRRQPPREARCCRDNGRCLVVAGIICTYFARRQ
jgi:hypothetical protein